MTDVQKQEVLDLHNTFRSTVNPAASNMLRMSWDPDLERIAVTFVQRCVIAHNQHRHQLLPNYDWVGENIAWGAGGCRGGVECGDIFEGVKRWHAERLNYDLTTGKCSGKCTLYTQLVWWESSRVGCGAKRCGDRSILVCNYAPGGNYVGQRPYRVGKPCSECPRGSTCRDRLCVPPMSEHVSDSTLPQLATNSDRPSGLAGPRPLLPSGWESLRMHLMQVDSGMSDSVWGLDTSRQVVVFRSDGKPLPVSGDMRHVSSGGSGVWAVSVSGNVYYRQGTTLENMEGVSWRPVKGTLKQIDSGPPGIVWGVSRFNQIFYRSGISKVLLPEGDGWVRVEGSLKYISCGEYGCWGVNKRNRVFFRTGVSARYPAGKQWVVVPGSLRMIESGPHGYTVGVDDDNEVFWRWGISSEKPQGTRWTKLGPKLTHVTVGRIGLVGIMLNESAALFRGFDVMLEEVTPTESPMSTPTMAVPMFDATTALPRLLSELVEMDSRVNTSTGIDMKTLPSLLSNQDTVGTIPQDLANKLMSLLQHHGDLLQQGHNIAANQSNAAVVYQSFSPRASPGLNDSKADEEHTFLGKNKSDSLIPSSKGAESVATTIDHVASEPRPIPSRKATTKSVTQKSALRTTTKSPRAIFKNVDNQTESEDGETSNTLNTQQPVPSPSDVETNESVVTTPTSVASETINADTTVPAATLSPLTTYSKATTKKPATIQTPAASPTTMATKTPPPTRALPTPAVSKASQRPRIKETAPTEGRGFPFVWPPVQTFMEDSFIGRNSIESNQEPELKIVNLEEQKKAASSPMLMVRADPEMLEACCTIPDSVCPVPRDCVGYVECRGFRGEYRACDAGKMFNPLTNICEYARNVDCPGILEGVVLPPSSAQKPANLVSTPTISKPASEPIMKQLQPNLPSYAYLPRELYLSTAARIVQVLKRPNFSNDMAVPRMDSTLKEGCPSWFTLTIRTEQNADIILGRDFDLFVTHKSYDDLLLNALLAARDLCVEGVLREAWFNLGPSPSLKVLYEDPRFPNNPDEYLILNRFEAPPNVGDGYGQRLSTYFRAPQTGMFTFYLACDNECELWVSSDQEEKNAVFLQELKGSHFVSFRNWNKYPQFQTSAPVFFSKDKYYFLEAFMKEGTVGDNLSVGVKFPNGTEEKPLEKNLFLVPGQVELKSTLMMKEPPSSLPLWKKPSQPSDKAFSESRTKDLSPMEEYNTIWDLARRRQLE